MNSGIQCTFPASKMSNTTIPVLTINLRLTFSQVVFTTKLAHAFSLMKQLYVPCSFYYMPCTLYVSSHLILITTMDGW